jgi:hypothetical protein
MMKNNSLLITTVRYSVYSLLLTFLFTACGGSGGGGDAVNDALNSVVADAGEDFSTYEKKQVKLDASLSQNATSYSWKQIGGSVNVSIIDSDQEQAYFVAPDVSEDVTLVFELEIKSLNLTKTDQVSVKILDVNLSENSQEVYTSNSVIAPSSRDINITYKYTQSSPDKIASGLNIKLFWDDTKLQFNNLDIHYLNDYMGYSSTAYEDMYNEDNDADTNKYIVVTWADLQNGKWDINTTLPMNLFSPNFTALVSEGATGVNLSAGYESPGFEFYGESVILQLNDINQ